MIQIISIVWYTYNVLLSWCVQSNPNFLYPEMLINVSRIASQPTLKNWLTTSELEFTLDGIE